MEAEDQLDIRGFVPFSKGYKFFLRITHQPPVHH